MEVKRKQEEEGGGDGEGKRGAGTERAPRQEKEEEDSEEVPYTQKTAHDTLSRKKTNTRAPRPTPEDLTWTL